MGSNQLDYKNLQETWALLNNLFNTDAPITKTQYFELTQTTRSLEGEVLLWLNVLAVTMEDWENYQNNPQIDVNRRRAKDIERWAYRESFALERMSESMYIGFKIDPDIFKSKFRKWLDSKRQLDLSNKFEFFEPVEDMTPLMEYGKEAFNKHE